MGSVLMIMRLVVLALERTQLGEKFGLSIADAMLEIISVAKTTYEQESGQPLDVSKIPKFEPIA